MKASVILATTGAMLAMAGPLGKRVLETDWVVQVVTVTVTAGAEPTGAVFMAPPVQEESAPTTTTRRHRQRPTTAVVIERPVSTSPSPAPAPTVAPEPVPEPEPVETQSEPEPEPTSSTPPPQETQPADSNLGDYANLMLEQHNVHRRNHSASDLSWDSTLAEYATTIAKSCVFAHDMDQGNGGYGQNLASWGASGDISDKQLQSGAAGVTMQWYNGEVENWDFYGQQNPPASSDLHLWGHFTQVVWAGTERVGCATVNCPAGTALSLPSWYTVCNYGPPGNFGGQYGANVLPPTGAPVVTV